MIGTTPRTLSFTFVNNTDTRPANMLCDRLGPTKNVENNYCAKKQQNTRQLKKSILCFTNNEHDHKQKVAAKRVLN
jgi:hypothetical protein